MMNRIKKGAFPGLRARVQNIVEKGGFVTESLIGVCDEFVGKGNGSNWLKKTILGERLKQNGPQDQRQFSCLITANGRQ